MENKFLILANWKANDPPVYNFSVPNNVEVAIAPPFPLISNIKSPFSRAAQDVSQFSEGAETGEVPAKVLSELAVKYVLVGHSERRKNFGETNLEVQEKINRAREFNITPIVCAQNPQEIPNDINECFVMYEPAEAISINGQYHPETPEAINTVLNNFPKNVRLLYGGSVNPQNCKSIIENSKLISGFVVGHASLDPRTFSDIINQCS